MNKHQFVAPGMFTNAIVTKPDITQLLKDASESQLVLYKVNELNKDDISLERVDGKSYFIDNGCENYISDELPPNKIRRIAVGVPELVPEEFNKASSEIGSSPTKSSTRSNDSLNEPEEVYRSIIETINKLPVTKDDFIHQINEMKQDYDELRKEINALEGKYDENQRVLHSNNLGMEGEGFDIDKELQKEEQEVASLEKQLKEREEALKSKQIN